MRLTKDITRRLQTGDTAYHFDGLACSCRLVTVASTIVSESLPENIGLDAHEIVYDSGKKACTMRYYLYCTIEKLIDEIDHEISSLSYLKQKIKKEPTTANGRTYQPPAPTVEAVSVDTHEAEAVGAHSIDRADRGKREV